MKKLIFLSVFFFISLFQAQAYVKETLEIKGHILSYTSEKVKFKTLNGSLIELPRKKYFDQDLSWQKDLTKVVRYKIQSKDVLILPLPKVKSISQKK